MARSPASETDRPVSCTGSAVKPFSIEGLKTDEEGHELWRSSEHGGIGYSVDQTSDGGYIIMGRTNTSDPENYDIYLIKTDENGEVK
jgi:hypothetical protein